MITYLIDIAILLTLAFFAWSGAKKGLILTLFSLLSLFVAWYGASFVSANFSRPVANIIRPSIQVMLDEVLEETFTGAPPDGAASSSDDAKASPLPSAAPAHTAAPAEEEPAGEVLTPQQILEVMDQFELFTGLQEFVDEAIEQERIQVVTTASAAVSAYLAQLIANAGLFGATFLLITLVWFLVSRALDLAFKLPILASINMACGALFGLVKGVLLILVLVWLAGLAGILTPENTGPVAGMMNVQRLSELLHAIVAGGQGAP